MRQRGRPRHPDLLTPREWEVLSLVREGLSNREIGDRLGVSRDGIKYHISQILPKLGVSTREEAAAWQPSVPATASAQPAGLASRLSRVSRVGLIGAAGALLAGLVLLGGAVAYGELSGGGDSPSESADVFGGGPPTASPRDSGIPTPSPDHTRAPPIASDGTLGSVAYVKDGNLWVLNLDTGDDRMMVQREIALTFGTTAQDLTMLSPEWSADGQWVAFGVRNAAADNATSIWAVRPSDGLLEGNGYGWYWEWSPTELVLAGGFGGTGVSRPVGSFPEGYYHGMYKSLGTGVGQGEGRWSPDGRYVAVPDASGPRLDPQSGNNSAPYHIKIVEPSVAGTAGPTLTPTDDSSGVTTIFTTNSGTSAPVLHSWSPDGKYLLFWSGSASNLDGELFLLSIDDPSNVEILGNTPVMQSGAAWSLDGSLLAVGQISGPLRMCRPGEGFLYNLGGDGAMDPSWSPDGSRIAFSKLGHITTAATDASDERSLTNDASSEDRYPQYSQDGSRILFIRLNAESILSGIASPTELWLMNSDGSDAHKIIDLPAVDTSTGGKGRYVDWTHYLSWYRPTGITPLEAAAGPSPIPTVDPFSSATPLGTKPRFTAIEDSEPGIP